MDVLNHIKEEHEEYRGMMKKIESATGEQKKKMFQELHAEIHGHHEAEETVVFAEVRKKVQGKDKETVLEMIEEHHLGKLQFKVLEETPVDDETWEAKFAVLKEVLDHHMKEEEKEFMPIARKAMPKEWLSESLVKFEAVLEENKRAKETELKEKHAVKR